MRRPILVVAMMITAILFASSAVAYAQQSDKTAPDKRTGPITIENHSWNGYHWARTANPFTLKLGNNLTTSDWTSHLATTSSDWSDDGTNATAPNPVNTDIVPGETKVKPCKPTIGRDEICNARYGRRGWIGLATVWVSSSHIVKGTVKVNDTYFDNPRYNNAAEKQHVMCQEVGHTLGLDHQSEDGESLNTCMDYHHNISDKDTQSTHPNQHDYDELAIIYSHTDSTTTIGQSAATTKVPPEANQPDFNDPNQWGKKVRSSPDGQEEVWRREFDGGHKVFNFVIRADKGSSSPRE